ELGARTQARHLLDRADDPRRVFAVARIGHRLSASHPIAARCVDDDHDRLPLRSARDGERFAQRPALTRGPQRDQSRFATMRRILPVVPGVAWMVPESDTCEPAVRAGIGKSAVVPDVLPLPLKLELTQLMRLDELRSVTGLPSPSSCNVYCPKAVPFSLSSTVPVSS